MRLVSMLVLLDSMLDPPTTRFPIPVLLIGCCSASCQLHNCVRYVPVRWISTELTHLMPSNSMPDSSTTRYPIPVVSTGQCSAPSQLSNGICYICTRWILMGWLSHMDLD